MNIKRLVAVAGIVVILGGATTACGNNNKRDLNNISSLNPDYAEIYNNTDEHPNIGLICIRGVAFATTTRNYNAIQRVEKWDAFCSQFKSQPIRTKQEGMN